MTVVLLLGEFIPKAIFRAKSDTLLNFFAPVVQYFYKLLFPVTSLLVKVAVWILKYVFNVRLTEKNIALNSVDLENFYQQNKPQDEETQELNTDLFENALSLPMVKIRQCLVPRTEIEGVDIESDILSSIC